MVYIAQDAGCLLYEYGILEEDVKSDIRSFSRSVVDQRLPKKSDALRAGLAERLAEKCCGMFLWIRLQEAQLRDGKNEKQLQQIVANMPSGLERAYQRDLSSILSLDEPQRNRAINILRFTMFAFRPLTVHEITDALVVIDDDSCQRFLIEELPDAIDEDYIQDEIKSLCGTLVQIRKAEGESTESSGTVHLVHFSVKEYLLSNCTELRTPQLSQLQIHDAAMQNDWLARICLRYLNYSEVWNGIEPGVHMSTEISKIRPFVKYAARFWFMHIYEGTGGSKDVTSLVNAFFHPRNPNWTHWQLIYEADTQTLNEPVEPLSNLAWSPLYYAAMFGFLETLRKLHKEGLDVNASGGRYGNPLQAAVVGGNYQTVQALLDFGAVVNLEGGLFGSSLLASAAMGHAHITELLIDAGSNISYRNKHGATSILLASERGHTDTVKLLLAGDLDLDTPCNEGFTPISCAAMNGQLDIVALLINSGANTNVANCDTQNPLYLAAENGHRDVVEILLNHGACVSTTSKEALGFSPMHSAARNGHMNVVELLLQRNADYNATSQKRWTPLHMAVCPAHIDIVELLVSSGAEIDAIAFAGQTSLHLAAMLGHCEILQLLLRSGADGEREDDLGSRPLHLAVYSGHQNVVELLLSYRLTLDAISRHGATPLLLAVQIRDKSIVKLLIDAGAKINDTMAEGSALHIAAKNGDEDIVKLLLDGGIEVNTTDSEGWYTSHLAAAYGNKDIVNLLHCYGEDLNLLSKHGWTPLILAAANGHAETVIALLAHNADVNLTNINQFTPLHSAARHGHVDVVKLLLDEGAYIAPDVRGWTPLHYATRFGQPKVVALLLNEGKDQNVAKYNGQIPLYLAAPSGQKDGAGFLLSNGADGNFSDQRGRTRLHSAADLKHQGIVRSPNQGKDDKILSDLALESSEKALHYKHAPKDILLASADKISCQTALHLGVIYHHSETIEILIRNGANPSLHDGYGKTCLDWARQDDQIFSRMGKAHITSEPTDLCTFVTSTERSKQTKKGL